MWHIFIMERIDQMENKQKPVERETRQLIQTYNVLLKSQIYAYFAKTQRDHFVGRAFKTLEKEKQIYIHQDLEMAAINELEKEVTLFAERSTYLPVISHNIKYINQYEFSLDDLEFYLGGHLREGKYYIDIRMLY